MRIYNQFVLGQEFSSHLYGCLQVASCVVAKVYYQILEAFLLQLGQGYEHFCISVLSEVLDAHIAGVVVNHVGGRDAFLGNVTSCHRVCLHPFHAIAHHTYFNFRVFGPFEPVHGFLVSDYFAREGFAVHTYNLVTSQ